MIWFTTFIYICLRSSKSTKKTSRAGKPLTRSMADKLLRAACQRIGVEGASTHSFRRTALTQMHNAGIPLRHIQEISGHNDLGTLQRYLEVSPEQKKKAVSVIGW